jgi:hypothetical protein
LIRSFRWSRTVGRTTVSLASSLRSAMVYARSATTRCLSRICRTWEPVLDDSHQYILATSMFYSWSGFQENIFIFMYMFISRSRHINIWYTVEFTMSSSWVYCGFTSLRFVKRPSSWVAQRNTVYSENVAIELKTAAAEAQENTEEREHLPLEAITRDWWRHIRLRRLNVQFKFFYLKLLGNNFLLHELWLICHQCEKL